jgi:hypothetical protein
MRGRELADRLSFDYRILNDMRCSTFDFEAYRTSWDLDERVNAVPPDGAISTVRKYRFILRIPTLVSADTFELVTEIGVDVDVADYPERQPNTYLLSRHVPWSPHFRSGYPVCIGSEFWDDRKGHIVLGELVIHLQRLLNWDEKGRGPGYAGWNADAIRHHREVLHGRPLHDDVVYAQLPGWLGGAEPDLLFDVRERTTPVSGFEVVE